MPATHPDNSLWLAGRLEALASAVAALQAQRTLYYADAAGVCVVIIGDVTHDSAGNPTGLTGTGIASFQVPTPGTWTKTA